MLCKHLSDARAGDGPVFLIDTDPQATLTAWHTKREAETPSRVDLPFEGLEKGLELIRSHGAAYCIIDTASWAARHRRPTFQAGRPRDFSGSAKRGRSNCRAGDGSKSQAQRGSFRFRVNPREAEYADNRSGRRDPLEAWTGGGNLRRRPDRL